MGEYVKNCRNCGAPLNEEGNCEYCGTKTPRAIVSTIEITPGCIRIGTVKSAGGSEIARHAET